MKPEKPTPDFPLFPHASGKWAKKIRGKLVYFGRWDDPNGALAEYRRHSSEIVVTTGLTVQDASNLFLTARQEDVESGILAQRSFQEYHRTCQRLSDFWGKATPIESLGQQDFSGYRSHRQTTCNLVNIGNEVTRVRTLFHWLVGAGLISAKPNFGPDFKKPSRRVLRRHRRLGGKKLFSADEVLRILDESGLQIRAMILLGINCAFGPADCATIPLSAIDLDRGMIEYPRPKTEIERFCTLWPETVSALRAALERRPEPLACAQGRFFVMHDGRNWDTQSIPIHHRFRLARISAGIKRGSFYWLRHTFETRAGEAKDQVAVNLIMGHVDDSMASTYRWEVIRPRLEAVTDYMRSWLFKTDSLSVEQGMAVA